MKGDEAMAKTIANEQNFYKNKQLDNIEIAILLEDIELPKIDKRPLTLSLLQAKAQTGDPIYRTKMSEYTPVTANFIIPTLLPYGEREEVTEEFNVAPTVITRNGVELESEEYNSTNTIELQIPKYIVMEFTDIIPHGTEFIIASVGKRLHKTQIRIIAIYSEFEEEEDEEEEGYTVKGGRKE